MCLLHQIGGAFRHQPEEIHDRLSSKASDLIKRAFDDVDPNKLIDHHTHLAGVGTGGTGAFVNPKMRTWSHPFHHLKFKVYLSAAGVDDEDKADAKFVERLKNLVDHNGVPTKHRLLAFDKHYNVDGTVNLDKTEFYVPNDYVFDLARRFPTSFVPTISVNPYRADALDELQRCASLGAKVVKWLPNAMGMDPASERCGPFYQKMKELGLVLLSHGGEEKAVEAEEDQKLGNPLRLRRALDHGVQVIVAHCASLGKNEDLDHPDKPLVDNFDLFIRLMDEKRYEGLVFGEISAMTQFNRIGKPLLTILEREDLHERIMNGSDYPLPAVNILIRTRDLVKCGYITADERESINEIYKFNPLTFDYVLKRLMKHPTKRTALPASVFMSSPH
jgi:uncharacterized protein